VGFYLDGFVVLYIDLMKPMTIIGSVIITIA